MGLKPICGKCRQQANLVTGAVVYPHRPDLAKLNFWKCDPCDAYVGCHAAGAYIEKADGTRIVSDGTLPKGTLADAELRRQRRAAHAAFDPLWEHSRKRNARREAYAWLARTLGIPYDECHIGSFDGAQCAAVVAACRSTKPIPQPSQQTA